MAPTKLTAIGHIYTFLVKEMLVQSKHKDGSYVTNVSNSFPVTGSVSAGNCGIPIPGDQRVHGTPGLDGPEPIELLREQRGP